MRRTTALLLLALPTALAACKSQSTHTAVTRRQCADLVRKEHRLRSGASSALGTAMEVGERADVDACLEKATPMAYRCVMHAESAADLGACDELMK